MQAWANFLSDKADPNVVSIGSRQKRPERLAALVAEAGGPF